MANWFFALFQISLALELTVTLFNRPKFVVPPAARHELGALTLW